MAKKEHIRRFKTVDEYNKVFGGFTPLENYPCVSFVDENKKVYYDDIPNPMDMYELFVTGENKVFYTDETELVNMKNQVQVQAVFSGVTGVECDSTPAGWNKLEDGGVYTYYFNMDINTSYAPRTEFAYTIKEFSEYYNGITVKKETEQYQITAIDCAYYGFATDKSLKEGTYVKKLERVQSDFDELVTMTNEYADDAYLVILTGGDGSATQSRFDMMGEPIEDVSFVSPVNGNIMLTGYRLYKSKNKVSGGTTLQDVMIHINVSNPKEPAPVPVVRCCPN